MKRHCRRATWRVLPVFAVLGRALTADVQPPGSAANSSEVEGAVIHASFEAAVGELSGVPSRISESGLSDIEGQVRWRWRRATAIGPEAFSYVEAVAPHRRDKALIGTPGLELKFGTGLSRGFRWGTLTARAAGALRKSRRHGTRRAFGVLPGGPAGAHRRRRALTHLTRRRARATPGRCVYFSSIAMTRGVPLTPCTVCIVPRVM